MDITDSSIPEERMIFTVKWGKLTIKRVFNSIKHILSSSRPSGNVMPLRQCLSRRERTK